MGTHSNVGQNIPIRHGFSLMGIAVKCLELLQLLVEVVCCGISAKGRVE